MPPSTRHRSLTARGRVTYTAHRLALLPQHFFPNADPGGDRTANPSLVSAAIPSALTMAPDRVVMQSPRSAGQCVQQTQQPLLARQ
jgi:hypothetical protein